MGVSEHDISYQNGNNIVPHYRIYDVPKAHILYIFL